MSNNQSSYPLIGEETNKLLVKYSSFEEEDKNNLLASSLDIFRKMPNFVSSEHIKSTGLVLGLVQSGKTASFTTVSALARDNGYAAVILITGISTLLLGQSTDRLIEDLGIKSRDSSWVYLNNPTQDNDLQVVQSTLMDWGNTRIPQSSKRSLFISVLKNHTHLKNLVGIFSQLAPDLIEGPILVIDDEADQASLNTEARNNLRRNQNYKESATYRYIGELKNILPKQAYLQYTATPQAVLLINILDRLSPDFHHILFPGSGYSGGKFFFDPVNKGLYTEEIPIADLIGSAGMRDDPPPSLIYAMQTYVIGIAAEIMKKWSRGEKLNRNISMLVHPSHRTNMHSEYDRWVSAILMQWKLTFNSSEDDPDKIALTEEFFDAYKDIQRTALEFPEWSHLKEYLNQAVLRINHEVLNAVEGETPEIDWDSSTYNILVGGQAVDRGFTVRGLTVTYLPRPSSNSNEDSLQQRARFFGYKHDLLGYCRVFLDDANYNNFKRYVSYEEQLRSDLLKIDDIKKWSRLFFDSLRPTRKNVIADELIFNVLSGWNIPEMPLMEERLLLNNQNETETFLKSLSFSEAPAKLCGSTAATKHYLAHSIEPKNFISYLESIKYESLNDAKQHLGLLTLIETAADKLGDDFKIDFYLMSKDWERERQLTSEWYWTQSSSESSLFQGRTASDSYGGDREVKSGGNIISVQLHNLLLKVPDANPVKNVPVLAIWIPKELQRRIMYTEPWNRQVIS
jgi:hypothetical protein